MLLSQTTTMENYTVGLVLLPLGSNVVTGKTITFTENVAIGAETATVIATGSNTGIKAGLSLSSKSNDESFREHVLVIEDTEIDSTNPTVIQIAPSKFDISAGSTTRLVDGLLPLFGVQEFSFSSNTTTADITNVLSGTSTESRPVRNSRSYQVSGKEFKGDPGLSLVKRLDRTSELFGRLVYVVSTYPDGEVVEGAATIENFTQPGNYNNVKEYSFTLTLQGSTFVWIESYT